MNIISSFFRGASCGFIHLYTALYAYSFFFLLPFFPLIGYTGTEPEEERRGRKGGLDGGGGKRREADHK